MVAKRRLPIPTGQSAPDRELSRDELRQMSIDIMGSWALEGLEPDDEIIGLVKDYIEGRVTHDDLLAQAKQWAAG